MACLVRRALPRFLVAHRLRPLGVALAGVSVALAGCGQGDDASPTTVAQSTGTTTTTTTPVITVTPPVVTTPTTPPVTTSPITTTPTTPDCSAVTPSTSDIVDGCGNISATAYRAMAPELGSEQGIAYRYGSSGACGVADGNQSLPTWTQKPDKWNDNGNFGWTYQYGTPSHDPRMDNYFANMGQALFVADDPSSHPGVTQLTTILYGQNTFAMEPMLPWQWGGGGDPDPNIVSYMTMYPALAHLSKPIAVGRGAGGGNWNAESLTAFPNGFIGASGSYTARSLWGVTLPTGKVPTAVSITNGSEFALVTVWDTVNLKGQVAVIALGGSAGYWGDWGYPGLANLGNFSFMKILGYVDLPGMMAPTGISATADNLPGWYCAAVPVAGTRCLSKAADLPLSDPAVRASFRPGGSNTGVEQNIAQSGVAVVISKTEKKAIFLDLKPLFAKVSAMYFSDTDYAKTTDVGPADAQWPYAFSVAPDFAPTVITTMTFQNAPTAVRTSLQQRSGVQPLAATRAPLSSRAWIATIDGTLHFIDVAGYARHAAAVPSDIKEVGSSPIGKNVTALAYTKHDPTEVTESTIWPLSGLIATSRGECKIQWLKLDDQNVSASVIRTLQDSRMVDPISAEDNDSVFVLSVADYGGKQILAYRYGGVDFGISPEAGDNVPLACPHPVGCPLPNNDPFEFGGGYKLKGKPFNFTEANVP